MPQIIIDGTTYDVKSGPSLLQTALSLGLNLPFFCWHPAMGSAGACRQCAVKQYANEKDARGRIVMACMTPVTEGLRVSIEDKDAVEFRAGVTEWLMTNHPHDCPVCDEGGECHLQDMTVMTGHNYRRYRFGKRTHLNQNLGPFINHEMNRCIACYRCVLFYREYAGGSDFGVFSAHNHVYFGRAADGVLENEFSGNLVEVCPTGVFTDKTFKQHFTRKWDLQNAPSVCHQCGLGCNILAGERYGSLRRIRNRYNSEVNGYFICDRGRFGYEYVNSPKRIREAVVREQSGKTQPGRIAAIEQVKALLQRGRNVVGIGSPRASLESNYALRTLVGADRFCTGMPAVETRLSTKIVDILRRGPARSASLHDVEMSDAVLILGEDVTNAAPMLDLALRQAIRRRPVRDAVKLNIPEWHAAAVREVVQDSRGPLYISAVAGTRLDAVSTKTYRAAPDDIARLGHAVAHEVDAASPVVEGLTREVAALAKEIAQALKSAERPLVISGMSLRNDAVVEAAANAAWSLCRAGKDARICYVVPEVNTLGLAMIGGRSLDDVFVTPSDSRIDGAVVVENDLYRRARAEDVDRFLARCGQVVALDHLQNRTTERAGVLLPAGTFAESSGTVVNNEGRAQRFLKVFVPAGEIGDSWRWIRDLMLAADRGEANAWENLDGVIRAMAVDIPALKGAVAAAPLSDFRRDGEKIPRQTHRYSGRTAIRANIQVSEPKPPDDPDTPLSFSMEGYPNQPPASLNPGFWVPGWNSIQSSFFYQQEVNGPLRGGDPGVRLLEPGAAGSPEYFRSVPAPFRRENGRWFVVPLYHIFGSEELSVESPGLATRVPGPYVAMNADDAAPFLPGGEGTVEFSIQGFPFRLPVVRVQDLPSGFAGIPSGLPGVSWAELPASVRIVAGGSK